MSEFCPGQKVLCINGRFAPDVWEWTDRAPMEGEIYTVSALVRCPHRLTGEHGGGLRLVEVDTETPISNNAPRINWDVARFVPLDIHETSTATREKRKLRKENSKTSPKRAPHLAPA